MNDSQLTTLEEVAAFLKLSSLVAFAKVNRLEAYRWVEQTLIRFDYPNRSKTEKGLIKEYLGKLTGYSRAQITRLVEKYRNTGRVQVKRCRRHTFPRRYAREEVERLARTDELHNFPNGNALRKIMQRMVGVYRVLEYRTLAQISVAHLYNLRKTAAYRRITKNYQKTRPRVVNLGERRQPEPNGAPGYLRVDTVHQGDEKLGGAKGVYHINITDEVIQWELTGAVERISEECLVPLLEALLNLFPFTLHEFHSDNGSEYVNAMVVALLNRLLMKLTKSRSRQTNDNALIEGKNGSIIRKWLGYGFIKQEEADRLNRFYFTVFHEYLNYHRPCAFATEIADGRKKGKIKKVYRPEDYQTPYEKLKSLKEVKDYLKPGVTLEVLEQISLRRNDNQMAVLVQAERAKLFEAIYPVALADQLTWPRAEVVKPVALVRSGSLLD